MIQGDAFQKEFNKDYHSNDAGQLDPKQWNCNLNVCSYQIIFTYPI